MNKSVLIFAFAWVIVASGKDNVLSLDPQIVGKTPAGFTLHFTGPGKIGTAKIISIDDPNKKALEIKGGDADPSHHTMYLLNRKVPGDYECSLKFRIQSGKSVQAAGVFFRMQDNRSDYYLLAVKPKDKKLFWTVFKNNKAVLGQKENQILEAQNGLMMMLHSSATLWRHQFLLELCFEHGQISLDGILSSTRSYADERLVIVRNDERTSGYALGKPSEQRTTFDQDHSWKLELEEFVQGVLGHAPIRNGTLSDAMQLMRTIEEIYAQSGFYDETGR